MGGVLVAGLALGVPGVLGLAALAVPEGLAEVAADLAGVLVAVLVPGLARAALAVPGVPAEAAVDLAVAADLAAARGMRGGRNGFRSRCTGSGPTIRRSSGSYRRNSWNG